MTDLSSAAEIPASVIEHKGFVEEIRDDRAFVRIYQNSACGSCQLQGGCASKTLGGNSGRLIEAKAEGNLQPGSPVIIRMNARDGVISVVLSFVLPLALLFSLILSLQSTGIREEYLALMGLGVLGLYYLVLSLFRNRLSRRISFTAVSAPEALPAFCEKETG